MHVLGAFIEGVCWCQVLAAKSWWQTLVAGVGNLLVAGDRMLSVAALAELGWLVAGV